MKRQLTVLAVTVVFSLAAAQVVEKTIFVPDSMYGVSSPEHAVYNPANNTVYIGGQYGRHVIAIDGATHQKVARIPVPGWVKAMCCNPNDNKVYTADIDDGSVTVIDCATNTVRAAVLVGGRPWALCYNPQDNKVYCAGVDDNPVWVIDGASDSVIAEVEVGSYPFALCYNRPPTLSTAPTPMTTTCQ